MRCPRCRNELRRSKKDPSYGLCDNCRKRYRWYDDEDDFDFDDEYQKPTSSRKERDSRSHVSVAPFKTWKLVSGILSIILFVFVSFQSCAAGLSNTLQENGEVGGSAGILVAIMLLSGGIVSIATRKGGKGGNIALIVLFGIGALFGFVLAGSYLDLKIWASWCLVCVIFAIACLFKK